MKTKPRILLWDLETSHNIVASYNLYERGGLSIPYRNILRERQIFCASWKWLGVAGMESERVDAGEEFCGSDKDVVRQLHGVLSEADAVVHHHGDAFDMRYFNARAIKHGLVPIPPLIQIDTKKIASAKFLFNSNRLDYLGEFLGVGRKVNTPQDLWLDCLHGKDSALNTMLRYNKGDVRLLERVFKKLQPHLPVATVRKLFRLDVRCPRCNSLNTKDKGTEMRADGSVYKAHQCNACGHRFNGKRISKGAA